MNDLLSIHLAMKVHRFNTYFSLATELLSVVVIVYLCVKCTKEKEKLLCLYEDFYNKKYKLIREP